jgi:hypothetical protein
MSETLYKDQIQDFFSSLFFWTTQHPLLQQFLEQTCQSLIAYDFQLWKKIIDSDQDIKWKASLCTILYVVALFRLYYSLSWDNGEQYSREPRLNKIELSEKTCLLLSEVVQPIFKVCSMFFEQNSIPVTVTFSWLSTMIDQIPTAWYREFIVRWLWDGVIHDDMFHELKKYIQANFFNSTLTATDLREWYRSPGIAVIKIWKLETKVIRDMRTLWRYRRW